MDKSPAILKQTKNKKYSRWILVRKVVQFFFLAVVIVLFLISRQDTPGNDLIDYFFRFDPLLAISSMVASRTFLLTSAIESGLAIILAIVAGRAWCGWICPLGTILDSTTIKKTNATKLPESLRSIKYGLLLMILTAALFGNLTLMFFDPLTIFYRSLTNVFLPILNQAVTVVENFLYPIPFFQDPLTWLESVLRPNLLPNSLQYFSQAILFGFVFFSILALNILAPRFWCRYICPLGGFLGLFSKFSIFRREVGESCRDCTLCSKRCPTGTINPNQGYVSDPSECTLCLECLKNCPDSTIKAHSPLKPGIRQSYDPSRRQLLISGAASIAGIALLKSGLEATHPQPFLLRPPGSTEDQILSTCLRCGECVRACPTNLIQPSGLNYGLEGLWTPTLVPEIGYCEFTCNTCGQVCPVAAIPALSIEDKQKTIIGKTFIDQNRCIAWADHKPCMVCEEMCPLPQKAVTLIEIEVTDPDGTKKTIKAPEVNRQLCIGCGICEYKCPVVGEAAIRVRLANPDLYAS